MIMEKITPEVLRSIAAELRAAEEGYYTIEQISKRYDGLTIDHAYAIQGINREKMLANGEVVTGKKIGLTSLAMQKSLGVDQPDYGFLYKSMDASETGIVLANSVLQPRVEGEFVFKLKKSLSGDVTAEEVLEATEYVVPAIEVVGSRIADWKLTIVDTIADNASCGMYLLGNDRIDPRQVDLRQIHMDLIRNGEVVNSGEGSAVLGDPAASVAWLVRCLGQYGATLDAGDVVLSGALSAAVPAVPGDSFTCDFGSYGQVSVKFA